MKAYKCVHLDCQIGLHVVLYTCDIALWKTQINATELLTKMSNCRQKLELFRWNNDVNCSLMLKGSHSYKMAWSWTTWRLEANKPSPTWKVDWNGLLTCRVEATAGLSSSPEKRVVKRQAPGTMELRRSKGVPIYAWIKTERKPKLNRGREGERARRKAMCACLALQAIRRLWPCKGQSAVCGVVRERRRLR